MKKILLSLLTIGLLVIPTVGLAVTPDVPPPMTGEDTLKVLDTVFKYIYSIALVLAAICIVLAGVYFITAAGDPEKVTKARNYLLYALIGVAVVVLAYGLIALVRVIVGAPAAGPPVQ